MLSKDDILRRKKMWDTVLDRVRTFFDSRGFTEFRTPLIVKSPGMEPNLQPFELEIKVPGSAPLSPPMTGGKSRVSPPDMEGLGEAVVKAALITSPEYSMKKLLGAGFEKIYTITPVFRNNESGPHNIPEFMMLEWYAPGNYTNLMDETEDLVKSVLENESSWPRLTFEEAQVDEHGDPHTELDRFFVTNYPVKQAALSKISEDGAYAQRFEVFADGFELCNGFVELTDPIEQRARFEKEQEERLQLGKTVFSIDEDLLEALGKIKTSVYGNALGIDRLVMLKYGVKEIRNIQLF